MTLRSVVSIASARLDNVLAEIAKNLGACAGSADPRLPCPTKLIVW